MYEPLNIPKLGFSLVASDALRFGLIHRRDLRFPDDPLADSLHIHEYVEILFNVSGDISFLVGDRLIPIRVGDAVVSRKGEIHMCIYNTRTVHEYYCLWIDTDFLDDILPFLSACDTSPVFSLEEEDRVKMYTLLEKLERAASDSEKRLDQSAYLLSLLSLMQGAHSGNDVKDSIPEEFSRILKKIDEDFTRIQRLSDIEGAQFISPATLNRWFRKYIRLSPKEFIEAKKLSYAASLLTSGKSVTEACMSSGFSDCSHFIMLFKKKFGETPLKYKKSR